MAAMITDGEFGWPVTSRRCQMFADMQDHPVHALLQSRHDVHDTQVIMRTVVPSYQRPDFETRLTPRRAECTSTRAANSNKLDPLEIEGHKLSSPYWALPPR
jgi:hypothetical protein